MVLLFVCWVVLFRKEWSFSMQLLQGLFINKSAGRRSWSLTQKLEFSKELKTNWNFTYHDFGPLLMAGFRAVNGTIIMNISVNYCRWRKDCFFEITSIDEHFTKTANQRLLNQNTSLFLPWRDLAKLRRFERRFEAFLCSYFNRRLIPKNSS